MFLAASETNPAPSELAAPELSRSLNENMPMPLSLSPGTTKCVLSSVPRRLGVVGAEVRQGGGQLDLVVGISVDRRVEAGAHQRPALHPKGMAMTVKKTRRGAVILIPACPGDQSLACDLCVIGVNMPNRLRLTPPRHTGRA